MYGLLLLALLPTQVDMSGVKAAAAKVDRTADNLRAALVAKVNSGYRWDSKHKDGWWYLYYAEALVGAYAPTKNIWREYDAATKVYGPEITPPWDAEAKLKKSNYGLVESKIGDKGERYTINGREVAKDEALAAVAEPGTPIPDDANKVRLTVIGTDAERKAVMNDLTTSPALADAKDQLVAQTLPPTHWTVAQSGFKTDGKPTIYLQAPDGKVLHRQDDYADGPAGLAAAVAGAIRKPHAAYEPKFDPDLRKILPLKGLENMGWILFVLAGVVLGYLVRGAGDQGGVPVSKKPKIEPTPGPVSPEPVDTQPASAALVVPVSPLVTIIEQHVAVVEAHKAAAEKNAKAFQSLAAMAKTA